jgi:hypothetical protein
MNDNGNFLWVQEEVHPTYFSEMGAKIISYVNNKQFVCFIHPVDFDGVTNT